jgi:hypothetical protein
MLRKLRKRRRAGWSVRANDQALSYVCYEGEPGATIGS